MRTNFYNINNKINYNLLNKIGLIETTMCKRKYYKIYL